jgi:hypothetical protein
MKMINTSKKISPKSYAKIAGLLYLIIAVAGGFSIGYMPSELFVPNDAEATAQNIVNNQALFQLGIAGDILVTLLEVVLTVILYKLFKSVNQTVALVATFSRMGMSIIMGMNLINYLIPSLILSDPSYLGSFGIEQQQSLALLFLGAHKYGEYAWQLFFGLHMVALGYLIIKSNYYPKLLGILMMLGSIGYSGDSIMRFMSLDSNVVSVSITAFLVLGVIGELLFTFWLLIKGIDIEKLENAGHKAIETIS